MPSSIYTLRPKPGKTWLQLLNEWKSRSNATIDWFDEQRADDSHNFHSTPIRECEARNYRDFILIVHKTVNGQRMNDCVGVGTSKPKAQDKAALLLSENKHLVSS